LAKVKEKWFKDILKVLCVKSDDERVLMKDEDVKTRWKEYFKKFAEWGVSERGGRGYPVERWFNRLN